MLTMSMMLLSGCVLVGVPDHVSWTYVVTSSGQNVSWTSPTPIRADGGQYEMLYAVNSASVMVSYLGIPFGPIDVTDMIPLDSMVVWRDAQGPCPLDFGWIFVSAPEGQIPPSLAYDWIVDVDASGIVTYSMTNVFVGQADYNLGWPWGTVTVDIISGAIDATLTVDIVPDPCYADIDGSGTVDIIDLLDAIGSWGLCVGCPADTNQDDVVDVTDLLLIVGSWGPCP